MTKITKRIRPLEVRPEPFTLRYYMTPEFNDFIEFSNHCKNQIVLKIQSILDFINKKMNVKLHLNIYDNGNISEIGLMKFKFEKECVGEHVFCVVSCRGVLKLKCEQYSFRLKESYSYFYVLLDKDINIQSVYYSAISYETLDSSLTLKFDNLLNLIEYDYVIQSMCLDYEIRKFKSKDMMCPYDDELFLHSLITNYTTETIELFPEFNSCGVYDFVSDDFTNRRTLYNMTLI